MKKDELIKLKRNNTFKFFEVLPNYLISETVKYVNKFNVGMNLGIDKKIIHSIILVKDKEIDTSIRSNTNLKKVLIGGSIYVIGNTILHHIRKKDG